MDILSILFDHLTVGRNLLDKEHKELVQFLNNDPMDISLKRLQKSCNKHLHYNYHFTILYLRLQNSLLGAAGWYVNVFAGHG